MNSLFYESEIQPIEEANDENDLFSRTQNLWLEKFKNEVLAYFTSGSIGDGYVTLEPLVKKDGLYDYPKEYYESVKKIYAEKFADRSDFDVKYEAEVRRYWETVKKTASDMVSLFMGYAYEYDMESDYGDYEEAYNTDQGARSLRLLKLFTLFPGKSWGNLLSRIHQCADEWEKLRNIYPNTEGVDDEDTSESDLRSSEWIVSQIGEKFLPLWKALIDRELIKKGRKPRSIYIAYGNVVDNLESEIPDGSVNAEHLFELADHVDDSTAFDSSHFWDTFVSEVGHYFDPDEYNDWHGLLPLSRAEAAEIYIDATKRITTYLAENASHYAEKIVELEDLVDAHCYQHGIDPESLYAAA
ncbi:MAG: hypothetical protein BWY19_01127 [bacterium ADurb.Bin212]|nr:MAG: hypothetical protein BWY19_01127 [bacterium ADurb.Bin212]